MIQFINKMRVLFAAASFVLLTLLFVMVGLVGGVYLKLVYPSLLPVLGYWVERHWAGVISRVICVAMGITVTVDWQGLQRPVKQRPLVILGVHQSDLLHTIIGQIFMEIAGGPLSMVVKHDLELKMGLLLDLLGLGVLIDRSDRESACARITHYVKQHSTAAFGLFPDGTRPTPTKVATHRKTKFLPWLKNTAAPRPRGFATLLQGITDAGLGSPRVVFVEHRTELPDYSFWQLYRLVGTVVEVRVHDVTNQVGQILRQGKSPEHRFAGVYLLLLSLYERANRWRKHDYTI